MSGMPWFPCEPGPLLGALAGMPPPKKLVYVIVLLRIYEAGGACPDSLDAIATRVGSSKKVVTAALDELFEEGRLYRGEGGIRNGKSDGVIAESASLLERRKISAKTAGLKSAEKRQTNQLKAPTIRRPFVDESSTHLQLQLQEDSLFPNGNRAPEPIVAKPKKPPKEPTPLEVARKELFDRGKEVLGEEAGGFVHKLLAAKHGNVALARAAIEQASTMDDPRQYVGGILRGGAKNGTDRDSLAKAGFAGIAARARYGAGADRSERDLAEDLRSENRRRDTA